MIDLPLPHTMVFAIDLDLKNVGVAFRGGKRIWSRQFEAPSTDPYSVFLSTRDRLLSDYAKVAKASPLVVIEEAIPTFHAKTGTIIKSQLHAVVACGLLDVGATVVFLPAVWLRSFVCPTKYEGKEGNAQAARRWGLPERILERNERSRRSPKPLLFEHEMDALLWATAVVYTQEFLAGERELLPYEQVIARKIGTKLGDGLRRGSKTATG